jgi:hypothetical protein
MELRLLHAPVPADLVQKVYDRAAAEGKTMAELITEVLSAYVDEPADDTPAEVPKKPRSSARKS